MPDQLIHQLQMHGSRDQGIMIQLIVDYLLHATHASSEITEGLIKLLGVNHVSYAAPQAHGIINVGLHREYSPSIVFIFS
jgi:hypothetical protein